MISNNLYYIGDTPSSVIELQNMLRYIGSINEAIPVVYVDGIFGNETKSAIIAFQNEKHLPPTGNVDIETYNLLKKEFLDLKSEEKANGISPFFSYLFSDSINPGDYSDDVYLLQLLLRRISLKVPETYCPLNGKYDETLEKIIILLKKYFNYPIEEQNGKIDCCFWNKLVNLSKSSIDFM